MSCSSLIARTALLGALATLAGCGGSKGDTMLMRESFNSDDTYSRSVAATSMQACEAARRVLLSQGYAVTRADAAGVEGSKNFQLKEADQSEQLNLRISCATQEGGKAQVFVSALQDRYALKKSLDLGQRRCRRAGLVVAAGGQYRRLAGACVHHHGAGRGLLQALFRALELVSAQCDPGRACCRERGPRTGCTAASGSGHTCGDGGTRADRSGCNARDCSAGHCRNVCFHNSRTAAGCTAAGRGPGSAPCTGTGTHADERAADRARNSAVTSEFTLRSGT